MEGSFVSNKVILDCILSFGWFPGVWILCAVVSKHSLCSIFIGGVSTAYEDGTECSETTAHKIQTPGNRLKERIQHSEHRESLKSEIILDCFPSFCTSLCTCFVTQREYLHLPVMCTTFLIFPRKGHNDLNKTTSHSRATLWVCASCDRVFITLCNKSSIHLSHMNIKSQQYSFHCPLARASVVLCLIRI